MNTTELKAYALAVSKTIKERAYMDAVAFRECEADRMAFMNDAGPMVLELIAAHEDAQGEIRALRATEQALRERVKALEEGRGLLQEAMSMLGSRLIKDTFGYEWHEKVSALLEQKP